MTTVAHHVLEDLRIPYRSYGSAVSGGVNFLGGQNVLTTAAQYLERRPGFATEMIPPPMGGYTGTIKRIFLWHKVASGVTSYFGMVCSTDTSNSYVYKFKFGTDSVAILLHTCTTSKSPFDFVTSDQTVFFGKDDVAGEMWKYDGTNLRKWGIDKPATAPTVGLASGTYNGIAGSATGTNWTTPGNVTADDSAYAVYSTTTQDNLITTNFGLAIPVGATILGIAISIKGHGSDATAANRQIQVGLTKNASALAGAAKTGITLNQTTDTTVVEGSSSDLWGTTWTAAELNASTFGLLLTDNDITAVGTLSINYITVTVTVQLNSATSGDFYRTTYGNSVTGHQSSVSDLSACTGPFTNKVAGIGVTASTDPQVDQIHVYRTTDGGSTNPIQMQELPNSPFANVTATVGDAALDTDLLDVFAPALRACDPPPPMRGFITVANRIAGFKDNTLYYSAFEEIGTSAVPEESWPSGADGNSRPYPSPIYALAPLSQGAAIFTAKKIYGVEGDSLDTFTWFTVLDKRGTQSNTAVAAAGNSILWLDTSKQFWLSDIGEMGLDIRGDLALLTPSSTQVVVHNAGEFNWVLICDVANGKILPANMDNRHWMTPWPVSGITALHSGETADGVVDLLAAIGGRIYKLVPGTYKDAGTPYASSIKTSLFKVSPESDPDVYGVVDYVALETDSYPATTLLQLNDDDPRLVDLTLWADLTGRVQQSVKRSTPGTYILRNEYPSQDTGNAQRMALYMKWEAADKNFKLYSIDAKYHING